MRCTTDVQVWLGLCGDNGNYASRIYLIYRPRLGGQRFSAHLVDAFAKLTQSLERNSDVMRTKPTTWLHHRLSMTRLSDKL